MLKRYNKKIRFFIYTQLKLVLQAANPEKNIAEVAIRYGQFLQTIFDFILVALAIFVIIKFMNSLKRKQPPAPAPVQVIPRQEVLLAEIRDLLKK